MKRTSKANDKTEKVTEPQGMDPSVSEARRGAPQTNQRRVCWAIKTLCEEVWALFPETPVEYSNYDQRNTALDVSFDRTALSHEDYALFDALLSTLTADVRVAEVILDRDEEPALVSMRPNARTQDKRRAFNLDRAYAVLVEDEEGSR